MKTAIIVGSEGQDGRIAFDLLLQKQYRVLGLGRGKVRSVGINWDGIIDITNAADVLRLTKEVAADEIYYLAACHQSSQDRLRDEAQLLKESQAVHVEGLLYFCEGIRMNSPKTRLFYAASSLIFEGTSTAMQDEETPFCPQSIYGMTKLNGLLLCRYYRAKYGLFTCSGILYNHESAYRGDNFISGKIIKAALNIKAGRQKDLVLGDLNAEVDWGYAPDYVQAMQCILNSIKADDFIIASGKKHSVREFVQTAFDLLGLDYKQYVREDPRLMTRKRRTLVGNSRKLSQLTGWRPTVDLRGMIKLLLGKNP
jgi:GDPmannose 4,6-dehydratase